MRQQLSLGGFVFSQQGEFAYETLERKSSGGWKRIDIVNAKPRPQNTGQDAETVRLSGTAFYAHGMNKLDELRDLQGVRAPLTLVDGRGVNWGRWTLDELRENQSRIIDDGTAMVINWEIQLTEYIDDADRSQSGG